jgi:hypothetical protein
MVVAGIEYLDDDAELYPDGAVHDATLARDARIQGLPCAGGHSAVFFPGGRLRLAWLARAADVGPVRCGAGIVYLHPNGSVLNAAVAEQQTLGDVVVPTGERVTLDDAGRLLEYSKSLTSDQHVRGLPCAAAFDVWLYASGRPSVVVLASASTVGGVAYPRGAELFLDEGGGVLRWYAVDLDSGQRYKQRVFGVFEAPFE